MEGGRQQPNVNLVTDKEGQVGDGTRSLFEFSGQLFIIFILHFVQGYT